MARTLGSFVLPESDEPITSEDEDQLDRAEFSARLADRICALDAPSGGVVAICGPWGTGKTSTLNLAKRRLRDAYDLQILDFNPWLFASADQLVQRFFAELSTFFRHDQSVGQRVAEHLEAYATVVVPQLSPLAFARGYVSSSGTVARLLAWLLRRRQPVTRSLAETRDELERDLQRLAKPVIVVLDDLDRLQPDELVEVLRLVRLTAKLPHVVYVMAFDWQQVQASLDATGINGGPYLEKIIDLRLDLPIPSQGLLLQLLASHLPSLSASNGPLVFDELRWPDTLMSCRHLLTTVRLSHWLCTFSVWRRN
jgi:predicted KAP-like P-loop ATPase